MTLTASVLREPAYHVPPLNCLRLKKPCRAQPPGAHRRKPQQKSDVTRLEQKLDGVAAILTASDLGASKVAGAPLQLPTQPFLSLTLYIDQFIKSSDEARLMLDVFRNEFMPHFPFVIIPPHMSLEELRGKKPFFFMVVMMIACRHDVPRQTALGKTLKEIIGQKMMTHGEQSLDLLQGLLVYLAWYHVNLHLGGQLTVVVHLVMSVMIDLGLNKHYTPRKYAKPQRDYFHLDRHETAARTLEDRRTYLGCFYMTSVVSMTARDFEAIRYTKYTEECYTMISEALEYPSDSYLVQLTKLNYLGDKISRTIVQREWDLSSGISAPIGAYVKSLEAELRKFKVSMSLELPQSVPLLMHYYAVETFLCEIALDDNVPASRYGSFSVTRLDMLFACLTSAKHFFDIFHSLPASTHFDLPYSTFTIVSHLYVVLSKLSLCIHDGWDQNYVASYLNFHDVLDRLSKKAEEARELILQANQLADSASSSNTLLRSVPLVWMTVTAKVQDIKAVHDARKAEQSRRPQPENPTSDLGAELPGLPSECAMPDTLSFFDFLDEPLWQNWA
ncbi:uncharacterized protein PV07_02677 [Cladophialophora immunda]|uniref:Transcription factor domain-containing protein n=1 Tax=Cladophialophora immunda TaxID=569365 RepID=A0A0D2B0C2_9EURO|nr:uncharacterized protein PV07_02677 [Cladophialophora immunda]KIW30992.1 hypothetical protein PV07_02677 [Cladophialophora immunda]